MKKSLLKLAGLISIVASLFLVSCKNETPTSPSLDTVLTLDKAQVSVTAYPGMNFVSWLPVTNANGYVLYIYVGGNCISSKTYSFYDDLCYVDTNIKNNVDYTYIVEAESSSSTGRQVVTQNSMSDKKTVKAIVPPYNTKAFDLGNSEKNPNSDFIVTSNNINISSLKNKVSISFPGKAYLMYEVSLIDSDKNIYAQENLYDPANNNVILYTDFTVTQPGTYKVKIIAKSSNTHFADSGVVISDNSTRVYNQILTATFYDVSGSINDTISVENTGNDGWNTITLPYQPDRYGYTKEGWRDNHGSVNTENSSYTLTETNTYFYPEYTWSLIEVNFFDDEGNIIVEPITRTLANDGESFNTITLPTIPEKVGYISDGYWYDSNGNSYSPNSYVILSDTTTNFIAKYIIKWEIGEITSENNVISYTLNCEAGSSYSVSWVDSYQGDDKLTELLADAGLSGNYCDVKVSIYSSDGSQNVVTNQDSGYNAPVTFTATVTGDYIIEVKPYNSSDTGYFAILIYKNY